MISNEYPESEISPWMKWTMLAADSWKKKSIILEREKINLILQPQGKHADFKITSNTVLDPLSYPWNLWKLELFDSAFKCWAMWAVLFYILI